MLLAALTLAPIDWAVVTLFIAGILVLGLSARLRDSSVLQYLAAGRNLSLTAFVATLVSTWYGGILGVGESVSYFGFGAWLLIGVPYYVFAVAYALWLAPKVREADQISIPERIAMRWGKKSGVLAGALIFLLAIPAAHVLMLGVLLQEFTGLDRTVAVSIAAIAGIALLYKGGLFADVRVSLLAFVMMYVGFACMALFCFLNYPPAATFQSIENKSLLTFTGGAPWTAIVSFFILGAWTLVDPAFHQRAASARTPETSRKGILISVGFWFLFDLLSIGSAMYAIALLKPLPEKLAFYPALAEKVLPPGLKAIFLCGILGTVATAMVGYTLVSGATLGREILGRLKGTSDDKTIKSWIRIGLVVAMAVAVPLGLSINSVVDLWYAWAGVAIGALLIPVLGSYASGRDGSRDGGTTFWAMLIAATSSMVWLIYGQRTNNPFLDVVLLKLDGKWKLMLPPVPETLKATETITYSLGTLLPGLVISAVILSAGWIAQRRNRHDG
ncbi:MAG: sodium:solute symporter [Fimbriimonas sp.]